MCVVLFLRVIVLCADVLRIIRARATCIYRANIVCGRGLYECALNRIHPVMSAAGEGSREDLLAEGILGILGPAVEHVDQKIADVR